MKLMPFLLFEGNCAEAMAFYQSCLGGELTISKVKDIPMAAQVPVEQLDKVAFANLTSGVLEVSATDWRNPTRLPKQANPVALFNSGGTYSELRTIFDKLAVGASKDLLDDLQQLPIGTYGHLADNYGVHWFFQGDKA
ncbi:MAG: VOC family protein [Candidatus Acidiferrales bacterium]